MKQTTHWDLLPWQKNNPYSYSPGGFMPGSRTWFNNAGSQKIIGGIQQRCAFPAIMNLNDVLASGRQDLIGMENFSAINVTEIGRFFWMKIRSKDPWRELIGCFYPMENRLKHRVRKKQKNLPPMWLTKIVRLGGKPWMKTTNRGLWLIWESNGYSCYPT